MLDAVGLDGKANLFFSCMYMYMHVVCVFSITKMNSAFMALLMYRSD